MKMYFVLFFYDIHVHNMCLKMSCNPEEIKDKIYMLFFFFILQIITAKNQLSFNLQNNAAAVGCLKTWSKTNKHPLSKTC